MPSPRRRRSRRPLLWRRGAAPRWLLGTLAAIATVGVMLPPATASGTVSVAVQNLVRALYFRRPLPHADAKAESLKLLKQQQQNQATNAAPGNAAAAAGEVEEAEDEPATPQPFLTIQFGPGDVAVPDGTYRDAGRPYAEHAALGISWGWNCDLDQLQSLRARDVGEPEALRGFVIPDRQGKCPREPIWSISLPEGEYTVKISSSDPDPKTSGLSADGEGCSIQGIALGELPAENSCARGFDTACRVLPRVVVEGGRPLQVAGSFAQKCDSLNYIEFYEASNETALSLATYTPGQANKVDESMLQAEPDLEKFLRDIADDDKNVLALSVNLGYLELALNWLCSVSTLGLRNYFFIATDHESFVALRQRAYPVFLVANTTTRAAAEYGTVEYQELILKRTQLVNKCLQLGYNVLLSDIDTVFVRNPLDYLPPNFDIVAQAEADGRLCAGFIYMRATYGVQTLWRRVAEAHEELVRTAKKTKRLEHPDASEQKLLLDLLPGAGLLVHKLDPDLFPHGRRYFGSQMTMQSDMLRKDRTKVVVVHNNYVVGLDNKIKRFKHFGLWFISNKAHGYACHRKL